MNRRQLAIAFGAVVLVLAGIVVLLATGGAEPVTRFAEDPPEAGGKAARGTPDPADVADIDFAEVRAEGDQIVFEARLGMKIPKRIKPGSLDLRWEVYEEGENTWLVTANLDVGPNASVVGLVNDFGGSTVLDSFPGDHEVNGDTWIIRIDPTELPDFPEEFSWRLETTYDRIAGAANTAVVKDQAPKEGFGDFVPDEQE